MPEQDSAQDPAQVFLTKTFWLPVAGMLVSKVAVAVQGWVPLNSTEQDAIVAVVVVIIIAAVRRVTNRPAYFIKPKKTETVKESTE